MPSSSSFEEAASRSLGDPRRLDYLEVHAKATRPVGGSVH